MTGGLGSGKTMWLVWYRKEKIPLDELVYANFHIKLKNTKYITFEEVWELEEGFLLLDEIQKFLDARRSMTAENIDNSYFFLDSRKDGLQIFATSQLKKMVGNRYRDLCDYYGRAYQLKDRYCYYIEKIGFMWNTFTIMKPYAERELYPLYDTNEKVKRYESKDTKAKRLKKMRPKQFFMMVKELYQSKQLGFRVGMSIPEIELILMENDESIFYAKYIYQLLKGN